MRLWALATVVVMVTMAPPPISTATTNRTTRLELRAANVHCSYFAKTLPPILTFPSGETVIVAMVTHHVCDDWDAMIKGDASMEDIYTWSSVQANEAYQGVETVCTSSWDPSTWKPPNREISSR
jgi:hypothetical protein